ncbi:MULTISPECIES: hypothetical protein [unclassified Pseudoalteromonas]|uniref:hypothetical protein n=1 Tax=unclassified Pseudoalteromonas TaxID=194690 RepID=UPI001F2EC0E9|nr:MULTISPECIES: hypothetical protein [unclassified Pseudoalteromonas]MCF2826892.1 hypothetical protein [Pseudoalteromonas sp. OF5H-5]MCF2830589.1 hypothetical protein [Pseudoalteromonas sp. DL2-H6]MCF2923979.1 hypothetical protein [Pseudoalteromonas sp. DL2-H1]
MANAQPQGLLEIRAMIGDHRKKPGYIFTNVLSQKQRQLVLFTAGFSRLDLDKHWNDMTLDERDKVRNGLMFLNNIVIEFIDANAMQPECFYHGAKPNTPRYSADSVVTPIKQH